MPTGCRAGARAVTGNAGGAGKGAAPDDRHQAKGHALASDALLMSADVVNIADARAARDRRNVFVAVLAVLLLAALCYGGGE